MPKVSSEIKHKLTQSEAVQRLKDNCEWAKGFYDLHEKWHDNVMEFNTSIQGVRIQGQVEVTDDSLRFTGNIPIIALPFKNWLPNILKNALKPKKAAEEIAQDLEETPLLFYIHIPKAGGTTLSEFIYSQCEIAGENNEGIIKNGVFSMPGGFFRESESGFPSEIQRILRRKDLRAVVGHFTFGLHNLIERPFQYITILRNPIDRVISLYHYLKLEDSMSLEDFANTCPYREIDNDQTRRIAGVNPGIEMCNEKDLEIAKENIRQHFTVVGTTERFDEAIALLKLKLNWYKEISVYPRNVNTGKRNVSFPDTAIKAVENRNLFDIELYRYANRLMDEMIADHGEVFFSLLEKQRKLDTFNPMATKGHIIS